jgi:hypothetical protein
MDLDAPIPNTTRRVDDQTELITEAAKEAAFAGQLSVPARGLAVFVPDNTTPFAVMTEGEVILGRRTGEGSEALVDLTNLDGFAKGVSRRHALIRAVENGYVIVDLNSSNGTWLNGQRLIPTRSHELPSGSVVQLGHLKLILIYQSPIGNKK